MPPPIPMIPTEATGQEDPQQGIHKTDPIHSKINKETVQHRELPPQYKECHSSRPVLQDLILRHRNRTITGRTRMHNPGDILILRSRDNRILINSDQDYTVIKLVSAISYKISLIPSIFI